ncbi:MAG: hypothetical protein V3T23_00135 [Nitrososphaerales archaeon]
MADVGSLIQSAQSRGLRLFLESGKVKVRAPQSLDGDTKALIEELRECKEDIKSTLAEDDPALSPEHWYPYFRDLHHKVIEETPNFDYLWLKQYRPDLYQAIKAKENEIDALQEARLSEVMEVMGEWRGFILKAEFEWKETNEKRQ